MPSRARRLIAKRRAHVFVACVLSCVCAGAASAQTATAAPDKFDIAAFDVTGVTRLEQGAVEEAVYPFEGPGRASADVENARKALEDAYKVGSPGTELEFAL